MTIELLAEKAAKYNRGGEHMLSKLRDIEQQLQELVPANFRFQHGQVGYSTHYKSSNIGSWDDVLCFVPTHAEHTSEWHPIPDKWNDAGDSGYMHNDFNTTYEKASRMETKAIAKEIPAFIQELARHFANQNGHFQNATVVLSKMLDAVKER